MNLQKKGDGSESSDDNSDKSGKDDEDDINVLPPKRKMPKRRAASKVSLQSQFELKSFFSFVSIRNSHNFNSFYYSMSIKFSVEN